MLPSSLTAAKGEGERRVSGALKQGHSTKGANHDRKS